MAWPLGGWLVSVTRLGGVVKEVGLRVTVDSASTADVDDVSGFAVFDAEVGGCGSDEPKGRGVVEGEDGVPLFVGHLNVKPR